MSYPGRSPPEVINGFPKPSVIGEVFEMCTQGRKLMTRVWRHLPAIWTPSSSTLFSQLQDHAPQIPRRSHESRLHLRTYVPEPANELQHHERYIPHFEFTAPYWLITGLAFPGCTDLPCTRAFRRYSCVPSDANLSTICASGRSSQNTN